MLDVAEVFCHRQAGQGDAHTGSRRLVHLAVDQRCLVQNAALAHFTVQVVALAGALTDAGKDGIAVVGRGDVINQFLNQNGLADTGTAEQTDLAALGVGADQVNDLDAGLENFRGGLLLVKGRSRTVDGPALDVLRRGLLVDGLAQQVEHAAQALVTNGHLDRFAGIHGIRTADKAVGGRHGNAAHDVIANVLGNLNDQLFAVVFQFNGVQKGGQFTVPESDVQYRSHDLYDLSDVFFWHSTHSFSGLFL